MQKPKVLVDFHHSSLLQSFIFLFERRLGGDVFRPIGTEWAEFGYWKVYEHPATIQQFLGINGATPDGTRPLNDVVSESNGIYHCHDIDSNETNKAIIYKAFMEMDIDIVIASLPVHIEPFKKLCELHPSKPKLIYQIGNAWTTDAGIAPNIMASANIQGVPADINFITYHQEFDTNIFCPTVGEPENNIYSFVNCFNISEHFVKDWQYFKKIEKLMPDYVFRSYGGQCRDGAAHGNKQVAKKMQEAKFIWHVKNAGDGYGHVLFNTAAVGKPCIVKKSYYAGKLGDKLLVDGVTCIDIDNLTIEGVMDKIRYYSEDNRYTSMCQKVYNNFMGQVDFAKEAEQLKVFLSNLK